MILAFLNNNKKRDMMINNKIMNKNISTSLEVSKGIIDFFLYKMIIVAK